MKGGYTSSIFEFALVRELDHVLCVSLTIVGRNCEQLMGSIETTYIGRDKITVWCVK